MLAFLLWLLATFGGVAPDGDPTITTAGANADQAGSDQPDDPIKRCIKCTVN